MSRLNGAAITAAPFPALVNRLLAIGGSHVMLGKGPVRKQYAAMVQEHGVTYPFKADVVVPMIPKACHWNAAALYVTGKTNGIGTGFVLTDINTPGKFYWIAHSWGILDNPYQVVETTEANRNAICYHGIEVQPDKDVTCKMHCPELLNRSLKLALDCALSVLPRSRKP